MISGINTYFVESTCDGESDLARTLWNVYVIVDIYNRNFNIPYVSFENFKVTPDIVWTGKH